MKGVKLVEDLLWGCTLIVYGVRADDFSEDMAT